MRRLEKYPPPSVARSLIAIGIQPNLPTVAMLKPLDDVKYSGSQNRKKYPVVSPKKRVPMKASARGLCARRRSASSGGTGQSSTAEIGCAVFVTRSQIGIQISPATPEIRNALRHP